MTSKRIFLCADHGLALIYFLQSDILPTLLNVGCQVVLLTDDALLPGLQAGDALYRGGDLSRGGDLYRSPLPTSHFPLPTSYGSALTLAGLRLPQLHHYAQHTAPQTQWWLNFLRRVGSSGRINTEAMDSYVNQVAVEEGRRRRLLLPLGRLIIALLRRSRQARQALVRLQQRYNPQVYADLFDQYRPDLVIASTYGWRMDRYLLREAAARQVKIAVAIVGWDNPSSYGLPAAPIDYLTCWSQIQKDELTLGADFPPERVHIGGVPAYDGYFRKQWLIPRDEYFRLHRLDPSRKLLTYAASFVSFAPNLPNVQTLARLVASDALALPCQLLIRLHPNHFSDNPLYAGEREQIRQLAQELPHVHLVEPVPLAGSLNYYSGEDMPEKSSMMAYSDVFLTVYSTMLVECAIHQRPMISLCLDTPGGWDAPQKYSLPLSQIGNWPTHSRFRAAAAGQVALSEAQLIQAINHSLLHPEASLPALRAFLAQECTFTDGSAGRRTGEFLLTCLPS